MSAVSLSWFVCLAAMLSAPALSGDGPRRCQEITVPMCRGIGYNLTYMPNIFSHDTQKEAGLEVHQFWPLVEIQCSPDLRLFLCSMYAPICVPDYQKPLPACKSLCRRVRRGCEPLMIQYGFAWPERMSCDGLPEYGDRHRLCMDFNSSSAGAAATGRSASPDRPKSTTPPTRPDVPETGSNCSCGCPAPLVHVTDPTSRLFNVAWTGGRRGCAMPCNGIYFGAEERSFVRFWIALWSSLCLISTSVTVLTFVVDRCRFRYPERAIIFLSACYTLVAVGYIVRLAAGHEMTACERLNKSTSIIRYATTGPAACTSVFLLIYFFGMASCLWWVVLTFTWFLTAGLKWGQEAIAAHAHYFHLIAWVVPAVQTIAALAVSAVDGDTVSGICYVGNEDLANLRGFVLGPLCAYLLFGTCFLVAGFVAMFRVRRDIRRRQLYPSSSVPTGAEKLDRFMVRVGVVSVLYIVPASTVVACLVYEQTYREDWEKSFVCSTRRSSTIRQPGETLSGDGDGTARPDFSVFALKYFASLAVGITSGFWIWTRKTLESWCRCGRRLCRCGKVAGPGSPGAKTEKGFSTATSLKLSVSVPTSFGVHVVEKHRCNPSLSLLPTPLSLAAEDSKLPSMYSRV